MSHPNRPENQSRRAFLKRLSAAGGVLLVAGEALASSPLVHRARPIGVQLYTVRDRMEKDFEGTLEKVAAIGYKEVEFAGYYNRKPEQVRTLLDKLGLVSPSVHAGMDLLRQDLNGQIAIAKTMGQQYLTIPALMEGFMGKMTPDLWKKYAAEFNKIGETVKAAGLQLAYHNHAFEFVPAGDGLTGFDVLVQNTDPALVAFEVDLMWATVGGHLPTDLVRKYPGRFAMWHVKDLKGITAAQEANKQGMAAMRTIMESIAAVGEGDIDFKPIFALEKQSGLKHIFVENDAPKDSLSNIEASFRNLSKMTA